MHFVSQESRNSPSLSTVPGLQRRFARFHHNLTKGGFLRWHASLPARRIGKVQDGLQQHSLSLLALLSGALGPVRVRALIFDALPQRVLALSICGIEQGVHD